MKKKKTHFILGVNDKKQTVTACGLRAAKDGIIHMPAQNITCKNCGKVLRRLTFLMITA